MPKIPGIRNPYEVYAETLRAWSSHVPLEMLDETPREKLLDAILRLFEALEVAGLRPAFIHLRAHPDPKKIGKLLPPLTAAMRQQCVTLNIALPHVLGVAAPYALALAALRWLVMWLDDKTPGKSRLMVMLDRDLGRLDAAVQYGLCWTNDQAQPIVLVQKR